MSQASPRRGFALLMVLWTLGFLALLGTSLAGTARQGMRRVANMLDAAAAEAAAEGALHQAIYAMLDPSEHHWNADGVPRILQSGAHRITLRIEDDNGKVNPNLAAPELMQALLLRLGAAPRQAAGLAAAILDWRSAGPEPSPLGAKAPQYAAAGRDYAPPGMAFEHLDELGAVLGMTPELLARLRPHLSLFTITDPDASTTDPVVAAALGVRMSGARRDPAAGPMVFTVSVAVQGPGGTAFSERSVVRLNALGEIRRYEILAREPGPAR